MPPIRCRGDALSSPSSLTRLKTRPNGLIQADWLLSGTGIGRESRATNHSESGSPVKEFTCLSLLGPIKTTSFYLVSRACSNPQIGGNVDIRRPKPNLPDAGTGMNEWSSSLLNRSIAHLHSRLEGLWPACFFPPRLRNPSDEHLCIYYLIPCNHDLDVLSSHETPLFWDQCLGRALFKGSFLSISF